MSKPLCLVDTSILLNILNVPDKNEHREEVFAAFQENGIVKGCMNGLRPAVVGMIGASLLSVAGTAFPLTAGWPALAGAGVLLAAALIASWKNVHPILIILASAAVGIALGYAGVLG